MSDDANTLGIILIATAAIALAVALIARRRAMPRIARVASAVLAVFLVGCLVLVGSSLLAAWSGGID